MEAIVHLILAGGTATTASPLGGKQLSEEEDNGDILHFLEHLTAACGGPKSGSRLFSRAAPLIGGSPCGWV